MTSDYWTEMADFDAELQRLLNGGLPSTEAPAWFGDVALLVRTAHAPARPDELAGEADIVARMVEVRLAVLAGAEVDADDGSGGVAPTVNGVNGHAHRNGTGLGVAGESDGRSDDLGHNGTSLSADGESDGDERTRNGTSIGAYAEADDNSRTNHGTRNGTSISAHAEAGDDSRSGSDARNETSLSAYAGTDDENRSNDGSRYGTSTGAYAEADDGSENRSNDGSRDGTSVGAHAEAGDDSRSGSDERTRDGVSVGASAEADDGSDSGSEPLQDRLRERIAVSDLDEYRAKHGGERYYVAKHAAAAPDEPPHAVARTVGRVIAMKAVAVTTAAIIGVAAAAAATTGIVANVVVPAINDHYRRPVPTSELQDEQKDERDEPGTSRSTRNRSSGIVPSPVVSVTDPATGEPLVSPSTTIPAPTSSSVPADTTTSTTDSTTTTTSEPPPPDTTPTSVGGDLHPFSP
jgi:hypothetical protein